MFTLFYYPNNASLVPHILLKHLNLDHKLELVDRKSQAHKSEQYLKLNPTGRIPTLAHNDFILQESAAIALYLNQCATDEPSLVPIEPQQKAIFDQWLMYLTSTLQSELMIYFYPDKHCPNKDQHNSISLQQEQRIAEMLSYIDQRLSKHSFVAGNQLTICDFFLFMLCIWADEIAKPPMSFNCLAAHLKQLVTLDSVQQVCKIEGIDLSIYQ